MVRITIDEVLKRKLSESGELVEICDESGCLVGRFIPETERSTNTWEEMFPELTDEEIERRLNSQDPRVSMEQVKEQLRNRM